MSYNIYIWYPIKHILLAFFENPSLDFIQSEPKSEPSPSLIKLHIYFLSEIR